MHMELWEVTLDVHVYDLCKQTVCSGRSICNYKKLEQLSTLSSLLTLSFFLDCCLHKYMYTCNLRYPTLDSLQPVHTRETYMHSCCTDKDQQNMLHQVNPAISMKATSPCHHTFSDKCKIKTIYIIITTIVTTPAQH